MTDFRCPEENPDDRLGYIAWHTDAKRRHKAGQRQRLCHDCQLWKWPDHKCSRFEQDIQCEQEIANANQP